MNPREKIFQDFLSDMMNEKYREYSQTEEYRLKRRSEEFLEDFMEGCLNIEQKNIMKDYYEEISTFYGKEIMRNYQQGFSDCVFLLRELEVLH